MARSKNSRSAAAKRALSLAIAEETKELQDQINAKDAEISRLHGVISQIGRIVAGVQAAPVPRTQTVPRAEEPVLPQGPKADLAGEDNLGEGRWV